MGCLVEERQEAWFWKIYELVIGIQVKQSFQVEKKPPLFAYLQACLHSNNLLNFMDCKQTRHGIVWYQEKPFPFHHTPDLAAYLLPGLRTHFAWLDQPIFLLLPCIHPNLSKYVIFQHWKQSVANSTDNLHTLWIDCFFFFLLLLSLPSDRCRMLLGRNGKQLSPLLQAGDSWSVYLFLTQMSFVTFHHLWCPFLCFLRSFTSLSEMGRSGLQKIFKKWIHHGFPQ